MSIFAMEQFIKIKKIYYYYKRNYMVGVILSVLHILSAIFVVFLILGLDAPEDKFKAVFDASANAPLVKGFAVGRTIFGQPSGDWLSGKLTDDELIAEVSERYRRLIKLWKSRQ